MAMNTEPHPIGVGLFMYGKWSRGKFRIPNAIAYIVAINHAELQSTALTSDDLDTPRAPSILCCL